MKPIYAAVNGVMLSKKSQISSNVQEEGLTNEGGHNLHKQARDKRGIAESLHPYINSTRLIACEVGIFFQKNMATLKNMPISLLNSSPMGTFFLEITVHTRQ